MGKLHRPRFGSLQFWPRKRAAKVLPRVNWGSFEQKGVTPKNKFLGFIGYKAGMISLVVKDQNQTSMTKGKNIVVPATVIECPPMRVLSVRAYKGNQVAKEVMASDVDKDLKRKIKLSKKTADLSAIEGSINEFSDLRLLVYSDSKKAGIKKSRDIAEIGLHGSIQEKLALAKSLMGKEINIEDVFEQGQLLDIHAVTKAKGFSGPVKRFGITLRSHKAEKGQRRPGSLGPERNPARVTFRVPMAGQLGFFTRVQYNNKILNLGKEWGELKGSDQKKFFEHYGDVKNPFCIVKGSAAGPQKRPMMLTYALRPTKDAKKQNFEVVEVI